MCANHGRLRSWQFPVLLVPNACRRGRVRWATLGYVLHRCCTAVQSWLHTHLCASARCILTSKPLLVSCRSLNSAPCLQLLCLHALINRHHPFLKHQQVDTEPPCSLNPAPMPYRHALAWHGVYTRTFPRCLRPNTVCVKQTVSTPPHLPRNSVSLQWRCTVEVVMKMQLWHWWQCFICSDIFSGMVAKQCRESC